MPLMEIWMTHLHRDSRTKEVESTAAWGGQLELGALTHSLRKHIVETIFLKNGDRLLKTKMESPPILWV